jgi:hypothetical protein
MGLLKGITGRVDLDGSGFERGAIKVEKAAEHLAHHVVTELTAAGAAAFGAFQIEELVRGAVEFAGRIHRLSEEFRVSTDTIQKWDRAAGRIGADAEMIGDAFNKTKKAREAALGGETAIANAFGKFGITMEDLRDTSRDTESILNQMVASVAGRTILDDEDVAGMEIFGKSGAKVLSAFQQLHELGPLKLVDERDIRNITELEKNFKELKRTAETFATGALGQAVEEVKLQVGAIKGVAGILGALSGGAKPKDAVTIAGGALAQPTAEPGETHHLTVQNQDPKKAAEDLKNLEAARLELAKKINEVHMSAMTSTERQAALKEQIAHFEDEATRQMIQGNDLAALKAAREAETLRGQLMADQKKGGKDLAVDSLNKIGVFVGGAENVLGATARDQLSVMLKTKTVAEKILEQITKSHRLGGDPYIP